MMRLSSLSDYAIVILSAIARQGRHVRSNATLIAEETGVPLPTAQKLVSRLSAAGLLTSSRGTGGGVMLARDAGEISLAEVIEAVEGPIAMTSCVEEGRHDCGLENACQVRPHWGAVNDAVKGALGGITLANLVTPAAFTPSAGERNSRRPQIDPARAEPVNAVGGSL